MVSKHWLRAAGFAALAALRGQKVVALDDYRKAPTDQSWPSLIGDLLARVDEE